MFEPLENGGVLIDGFPAYAITPDGKVWTRFAMGCSFACSRKAVRRINRQDWANYNRKKLESH